MTQTVGKHAESEFGRPFPYVLMYHSVAACTDDPYLVTVDPERFRAQLRWLRRSGLTGVSLRELLHARRTRGARGLVGLTFDDGYADFADTVLPALREHGCTATVYVIAGRLGGQNDWDVLGPRKPLMARQEIRHVARHGMEIGSHGMLHRRLPGLTGAELRDEVAESRSVLRDISGQEVDGLCYPYGDVDDRVVEAVRAAGYDHACAIWRSALSGRYALPRTYIGDRDRSLRLLAKRFRHELTARR